MNFLGQGFQKLWGRAKQTDTQTDADATESFTTTATVDYNK